MNEVQPNFTGILLVTVAFGFLTFVVVTTTAFAKIAVVMFLVRNALGIQQTPPNLVLYGISIALTLFIGAPVLERVSEIVMDPSQTPQTFGDYVAFVGKVQEPVREFLLRHTTEPDRQVILASTDRLWTAEFRARASSTDFSILVPAFMIAELKKAFQIGFLLYLPFVVIDLLVTTILMAMGMSQVTPTTIAVPFKLLLFVAVEGWSRLIRGLILSYA